jgi:hypothetical protein
VRFTAETPLYRRRKGSRGKDSLIPADIDFKRAGISDGRIVESNPDEIQGASIMSETFQINEHLYRAYPARFFCDGIEITSAEFYAAIRSFYHRD